MFGRFFTRRNLIAAGTAAFLAGCKVVPSAPPTQAPPPPEPERPASQLPTDTERHRVALLVPLSGSNANVGQSIANAATMAILDTGAKNLRVTNYDTATGAANAAQRAIADGNKLILGPLLSDNISAIAAVARPADVPMISFSNDEKAAAKDVFVMGNLPGQSVARSVSYARQQGIDTFAALVPRGEYGQRASDALMAAARANGARVVAMESYDRGNTSIRSAAQRLNAKGGFDAVLIADGGRMAITAAPLLREGSDARFIGTELWSGEKSVFDSPAMQGAWFAAVSDARFGQFSKSYNSRFGSQPFRIATLGYDAVLLALRVAQDWTPGRDFPVRQLGDKGGFLGLDGPFRFTSDGVIERAFDVREVRRGTTVTVSPAPTRFGD